MEKKIEIIENFKRAITSTVKSIIGDENVEVVFSDNVNNKNTDDMIKELKVSKQKNLRLK